MVTGTVVTLALHGTQSQMKQTNGVNSIKNAIYPCQTR